MRVLIVKMRSDFSIGGQLDTMTEISQTCQSFQGMNMYSKGSHSFIVILNDQTTDTIIPHKPMDQNVFLVLSKTISQTSEPI